MPKKILKYEVSIVFMLYKIFFAKKPKVNCSTDVANVEENHSQHWLLVRIGKKKISLNANASKDEDVLSSDAGDAVALARVTGDAPAGRCGNRRGRSGET